MRKHKFNFKKEIMFLKEYRKIHYEIAVKMFTINDHTSWYLDIV